VWGERLKQPQIRKNRKLEPVSWDEALELVTRRLNEFIEASKPVGVLGSARATNEENYLAGKLARVGLHTNNVDSSYHSQLRPLLAGIEEVCGEPIPTAALNDIASSQAILLLEGNLAETHPRAASMVMSAVKKGAFLVTIGYRMTQMTGLSSLHLQSIPGNEGELIRGLLAVALELRQQNWRLDRVPGKPYEALLRDLENIKPSEELRLAAERFMDAERATFLLTCSGGQGDLAGEDAAAIATLADVTGHLGRHGSGLLPLFVRSNVRGVCDMGIAPGRLPDYERLGDEGARQRLQDLWGEKLPSDTGRSVEDLLQTVSGLIVLADDPPSVVPMGDRAKTAMERMEFVVVLDAFVTPTVKIAHAVLPIASFAETDGTVTNVESRVQRLRAAVSPPGKARVGWQVLAELCARLGVGGSYTSARDVLCEIERAAPRYAGIEHRLSKDGWSGALLEDGDTAKFTLYSSKTATARKLTPAGRSHVLVLDDSFDWGSDPLVLFSPTLSRDTLSERKLFSSGYVEMSEWDVGAIKLGGGRRIRLTSDYGEAVVPIRVRKDLGPGVLSVPYAFRDKLRAVMGTDSVKPVNVGLP
jgi:predicted molibdopterin-dependent oxidoreductase YjgC